jgi:restriction endonuclease S subunit
MQAVTSGAILHLQIKDTQKILPEYLTLVLNSLVVSQQAERDSGGSVIQHWRIEEIKNVIVPLLPAEVQRRIAGLVQKSFALRKKSEELLEEAKAAVEAEIEGGNHG